ncbi:alpha/beta hydrolase [Marinobacterium sediminicola]|uniref:PGAP1-like protein n=1 Tax=Marinobacterium sediminicola TaxID=518898 RepID=A0ABY1S3U2_9GAMM|nr:alpha/beta hydrolase [Marinobacterium sediminicola]ULG69210.1 alpha/beta hydrolase [Marinobacterium sediminicola]SMR78301.1 PGAP1-like protein [Marinobacterium sediminicola]
MNIKKVVVLHGLYMSGLVMYPLCRRLEKQGYATLNLSYNTLSPDMNAICDRIDGFVAGEPTAFVCHSMGGLIARRYLEHGSEQSRWVDTVITLGTPHKGSSLAKEINASKLKGMLKDSIEYLLADNQHWPFPARLYSIAGDLPVGLMPFLSPESESDGTVLIDETRVTGMTEHKVFPLSHTSLIYSRRVLAYILKVLEGNDTN